MFSIMTDIGVNSAGNYTKLESITSDYYWSSTPNAAYANYAWSGNF
jgi:hypothetical protein